MKQKLILLTTLFLSVQVQSCAILAGAAAVTGASYYAGKGVGEREDERIRTENMVKVQEENAQQQKALVSKDVKTTNEINQRIVAGSVPQMAVYPEVKNGVVILHGRVADAATAQRIIDTTRATPGVTRIISNLVVVNQYQPQPQALGAYPQFQQPQYQQYAPNQYAAPAAAGAVVAPAQYQQPTQLAPQQYAPAQNTPQIIPAVVPVPQSSQQNQTQTQSRYTQPQYQQPPSYAAVPAVIPNQNNADKQKAKFAAEQQKAKYQVGSAAAKSSEQKLSIPEKKAVSSSPSKKSTTKVASTKPKKVEKAKAEHQEVASQPVKPPTPQPEQPKVMSEEELRKFSEADNDTAYVGYKKKVTLTPPKPTAPQYTQPPTNIQNLPPSIAPQVVTPYQPPVETYTPPAPTQPEINLDNIPTPTPSSDNDNLYELYFIN